ncbi:YciI family protein [Fodinicola feengrottensis]|nr:YciI family protein [Fodinicola feengrottensis]
MLLIYGNDRTWGEMSKLGADQVMAAHQDVIKDLTAADEYLGSEGLTAIGARTVRVSAAGVPAVTDGPFTEAKEVLAGYYLIDCASIDRAAEIAARLPEAAFSPIEVRRVMANEEITM